MSNEMIQKDFSSVPDYIKKNSNRGIEKVGVDDIEIPRLLLVQGLSKCRTKTETEYIEGIEEGEMYNNVTRKNYGSSVLIVPVMYQKEYLVWRDPDLGGGFSGAFHDVEEGRQVISEKKNPDEWEMVPTHQFYCLLLDSSNVGTENEQFEQIVLSLSKSKNKVAKRWNSIIKMHGGDSFSFYYNLRGVNAQNANGLSYYNLSISNPVDYVTPRVYSAAESLYNQVVKGKVKINREEQEENLDF